MIRLTFVPPVGDSDWDHWVEKAQAEVALRRAESEATSKAKSKAKDKLYKEPRRRLFEAAHKKCAYCEVQLLVGQKEGDVEHYRPKAQARAADGTVVKIYRDGAEVDHPGYFWLAYDYTNLLPACIACNRRAEDVASGKVTGKGDYFPTLDENWAATPEEVATEQPALLNPWLEADDPADHLWFDLETGHVFGKTERGKITVEVLGLNREGLPEARLEACVAVDNAMLSTMGGGGTDAVKRQNVRFLRAVIEGSAQYAAICRIEQALQLKEFEQRFAQAAGLG